MIIQSYPTYHADEILPLYCAVGWTAYTDVPDTLRAAYAGSLLSLAAYDGDALVGMIRAVGDGCTIVFIQDLLVHPDHQRKGIGTALMRAMLARFPHVRQIELAADGTPQTRAFYRALGFREMPELGCCGFMLLQT